MSFQSLIMSNLKLANLFMSRMPAQFWANQAEKKALALFRIAAERIPAYRDFLKKNQVDIRSIKSIDDFKELPVIDKKNYIEKYDIKELCLDGTLKGKYTIERSSGHSAGSFFWPRISEEDRTFPKYIEFAFRQFYEIDKKHTLVIVTLAQGTWTSGEKMGQALREIAIKDAYPLSVMTPGADIDETVEIIADLSCRYEQTVIVGYPPFVKSVIDEGIRRGIDWKRLTVKLGLGGEGYSEEWREYMADILGIKERELLGISGGYGAADVGMSIAREYPITVLVRKLAFRDRNFAKDLFGENSFLPSFMQYNPASVFIEEVDQEVVFTTKSGFCPIRYNIHDRGGIIPFERVLQILESHNYYVIDLLKEYGYSRQHVWQLPFFYVFGRSDGTISISGPNVYPENIESALYEKKTDRVNSFKLSKRVDENQSEQLYILIEHKKGQGISSESEKAKLEKEYHDLFLNKLLEVNKDFHHMYEHNSNIDPAVKIYAFGKGPFANCGEIKRRYIHKQ